MKAREEGMISLRQCLWFIFVLLVAIWPFWFDRLDFDYSGVSEVEKYIDNHDLNELLFIEFYTGFIIIYFVILLLFQTTLFQKTSTK